MNSKEKAARKLSLPFDDSGNAEDKQKNSVKQSKKKEKSDLTQIQHLNPAHNKLIKNTGGKRNRTSLLSPRQHQLKPYRLTDLLKNNEDKKYIDGAFRQILQSPSKRKKLMALNHQNMDICSKCKKVIEQQIQQINSSDQNSLKLSMSRAFNVISSFSQLRQLVAIQFEAYQRDIHKMNEKLVHTFENVIIEKQQRIFLLELENIDLKEKATKYERDHKPIKIHDGGKKGELMGQKYKTQGDENISLDNMSDFEKRSNFTARMILKPQKKEEQDDGSDDESNEIQTNRNNAKNISPVLKELKELENFIISQIRSKQHRNSSCYKFNEEDG